MLTLFPLPVPTDVPATFPASDTLHSCRLLLHTAAGGHRYYRMKANGDGTFTARYGRIGGQGSRNVYPMYRWEEIRREKLTAGYREEHPHAAGSEV